VKKTNKTKNFFQRKHFAVTLAVILIVCVSALAALKIRYYNEASDQAGIVSIRGLILTSVQAVKKNAPVDPKTGDVYFPESHLYVPPPETPLTITYLYDAGNIADSQSELSVSTYPVRGSEKLYIAKDMNELFAAVPKLQACSRGVKLVYNKFPASDTNNVLKHTVSLNNGKTLYIYLEKECPDLNFLADELVGVKAY
jgi:hypothetical protein